MNYYQFDDNDRLLSKQVNEELSHEAYKYLLTINKDLLLRVRYYEKKVLDKQNNVEKEYILDKMKKERRLETKQVIIDRKLKKAIDDMH